MNRCSSMPTSSAFCKQSRRLNRSTFISMSYYKGHKMVVKVHYRNKVSSSPPTPMRFLW